MATQIQIELTVDEKGAVQGIRSLGGSSTEATAAIAKLNEQMKAAATSAKSLSAATAAVGEATQTLAQSNATALEAYMARTQQVTKAVTQSAAVSQERVKALMAQVEALQAMGPKAMKVFNEQIVGFQKQGMGPFAAQEAALQSTLNLLEKNKNAMRGFAGASGEARVIMGGLTGSTRAMEYGLASMVGRFKGLAPIMQAAMPLAMFSAGAAILVSMGESVYNLYEKWIDTDGAIEKYNEKAAQAAQQRFFEDSGIDDLTRGLQQASRQLDSLNEKRAQSPTAGDLMIAGMSPGGAAAMAIAGRSDLQHPVFGMRDANALNQAQGEVTQDTLKLLGETHQRNIDSIRDEGLLTTARLSGIAKTRAEQREADREAAENQINRIALQQALHEVSSRAGKKPGEQGYVPAPTANPELMGTAKHRIAELERQKPGETGEAERQREEANAATKFKAARIQDETRVQEEIQRLREQADEATKSGIDLLEAQRKNANDEFVRHYGESAEARLQIDRRYFAEEKKMADRQRQEGERELEQIREQRRLSGLSGAARVKEEGAERLRNFYSTPHPNMNPGQQLAAVHEITQQTANQLGELQKEFSERADEVVSESASRTLYGYARIEADTQRQIESFKKQAAAAGAKPDDLFRGETAIRQAGTDEAAELRQRNSDETARIEMEARAKSLSAERQQTAAIVAEYEERTRQYQAELDKQLAGGKLNAQEIASVWNDFNRRMAAAAEMRDADIAEAAKRERDKMAGEFSSFFRNPLDTLKEMGSKAAGQAAAAMVQRIEGRFGGERAPLSGDFGLESVWSHLGSRTRGSEIERRAERASTHETASGMFSVSAAHIIIGSASIAFGAARSGLASAPSGASYMPAVYTAGGSTAAVSSAGSYGLPNFTGSAGGSGASGVMADLTQGASLGRQAFNIFHGSGSTNPMGNMDVLNPDLSNLSIGKDGSVVRSGSTNGGMFGGGGFKSNIGGAAGGAMGLFSAYEGNGGAGGALSGAMSGMQLGMALGGPIGAGIGAAAGALVGVMGFGGREKARVYDLKNVRPRIAEELQAYQTGGSNYLSTYSDLQSLDMEAKNTTNKMGFPGQRYYQSVIKGEIHAAEARLTGEERGGRSNFGMSAAQFATGIDRVPYDGYAVLHKNESVFTADRTERMTRAFEAMPSMASVAAGYRMAMTSSSARQPMSSGDRTLHMNVNAIDSKSVAQFFNANKHHMRAALNASYAENSGGADAY